MSAKNEDNWAKRLAGRPPEDYWKPEEVPVWSDLYYPTLDEVKEYPTHPKPYTWSGVVERYLLGPDQLSLRPDVLLAPRRLFGPRLPNPPWLSHVPHATTPLGPRRVQLDHLGPQVAHLPKYIPPDAPVISHWSNEYEDAPDCHGAVVHCHWCNRPFASLGVMMNVEHRDRYVAPDDPDQRVRHVYCNSNCKHLWDAYCGQWVSRRSFRVERARDKYIQRNLPQRIATGRTAHKWTLNNKYNVRWNFLLRCVNTDGDTLMNEIIPARGKTPPITKAQRNKLRQQIFRDSEDLVRMAKAVLSGDHEWNSSQVQVFKTLMGKVLPDAHVAEEHTEEARAIENLTTEEIEALIAETEGHAPPVIDAEPTRVINPTEDDDPASVV